MTPLPRFVCPRCWTESLDAKDIEHGYCVTCHDWTGEPGHVTHECPACGLPVTMRPYDIGSGPEMACPHCESCWGLNGQPLGPIDPKVVEGIARTVAALGPIVPKPSKGGQDERR